MKKIIYVLLVIFAVQSSGIGFAEQRVPAREAVEVTANELDFVVLSLKDCVDMALQNSFEVKLAKLDLLIAETDKMYAEAVFDAFLFGNVGYDEDKREQLSVFSADDNQTNTYAAGISKTIPTGTELKATFSDARSWSNSTFISKNPAHSAELLLEARQPVGKNFFGYIDRGNISIAKLAVKNADIGTQDRIEAFVADVIKAYWTLAYHKRSVDINAGMLDRAKTLYDSQAKNFDMGIIEKGDLLATEANLFSKKTNLMLARNGYREAEENLKLLMNIEDSARIVPGDIYSFKKVDGTLEKCLKTAFEKSRKYNMDKREVEIKNIDLKLKENAMWPEIDLVGSFAMNGIDAKLGKAAGKTTVADNTYYYAGIEVTVPVENSAARAERNAASYGKEKAIVRLKETERTIITQVGNSHRNVETFLKTSVNTKETVRLQGEKLQEEEKRFRQGRSRIKTLIDYQNDLLLAELQEAVDIRNLHTANVDLERAMNTLLSKYEELL